MTDQPTLCEHGYDQRLCRDDMPDWLQAEVDYGHKHAFDWGVFAGLPDEKAEAYASWFAQQVAIQGGLSYAGAHPDRFEEFRDAHPEALR